MERVAIISPTGCKLQTFPAILSVQAIAKQNAVDLADQGTL